MSFTSNRTVCMASSGKKKTTMAKLTRESRLRERRMEKAAKKRARKEEAAFRASNPDAELEAVGEPTTEDHPEATPAA
jgi:hypothetical protein